MSNHIVVPYTRLKDGVLEPLLTEGIDIDLRYVGSDDEAYWRLLRELWAQGNSFTIIEQDVVVDGGTLRSFNACPNGYCGAGYAYLGSQSYVGLGCTRFRAEFIAEFPNLIEQAGEYHDASHPCRHWCVCDASMQFILRDHRRFACANHGTVEHLGPCTPTHGCC